MCAAALSADEIALNRKMISRNVEKMMCLKCFAGYFETDVETLLEKIVEFKRGDCKLFDR
jgi:hypothetical protein